MCISLEYTCFVKEVEKTKITARTLVLCLLRRQPAARLISCICPLTNSALTGTVYPVKAARSRRQLEKARGDVLVNDVSFCFGG